MDPQGGRGSARSFVSAITVPDDAFVGDVLYMHLMHVASLCLVKLHGVSLVLPTIRGSRLSLMHSGVQKYSRLQAD
jgi:hypothetical protein